MIQLSLGQARPEVAKVCGTSGMSVTDVRVIDRINSAVQELMNEGDWPNVVDRWHVVLGDTGRIVLPSFLDRLMQVNIRGVPQTIASPWYQFVAYGPGTPDDACGNGVWWTNDIGGWMVEDHGEYPVTTPIPEDGADGPWVLRVYTAVDETVDGETPYCTIQGLDTDGLFIRSQVSDGTGGDEWIDGVRVELDFSQPYIETTQEFSKIDSFTKPETNGYIRLTAWNGTDEIELSNYLASDTSPSYHHYFSPWCNQYQNWGGNGDCPRVVRARARKRYVPAREDSDLLIISNLPALKEMVIAQWKREADNLESYAVHKATSIDLLRREALSYRGKSRVPSLTFTRGFAIGSGMPFVR